MAPIDPDVPIPLTRWIRGHIQVHFRSGHVADLEVSLRTAHTMRLQIDAIQDGESIDGLASHQGWIAAKSDEIVLTEWTPDPEYGWHDTSPDDRETLRRLGMRHGVLGALAALWSDRGGQPAYSINAVSTLFGLATKGSVSREKWDRIAEMVEGEEGAAFLTKALTETSHSVPDWSVNDDLEPDPAPANAGDTTPDSASDDPSGESPDAARREGAVPPDSTLRDDHHDDG